MFDVDIFYGCGYDGGVGVDVEIFVFFIEYIVYGVNEV